ncbi:MAG: zinc-ribbon domain-containing protein [Lachnospiraceae bacterium]|nr:zinc-ribbon domain-containing protein [Lachnospiraceae bacterium]
MKKVRYEDSLAARKPELIQEWDYACNEGFNPETISYSSHSKVSWICNYGHRWRATISNRVYGKQCPYCKNKKLLKGFNDFAVKNPDKLKLWDYEKNKEKDPSDYLFNSSEEIWWKCKRGHEWLMAIGKVSKGRECPYCNNKLVLKGFNDLEFLYPRIAQLWDYERNKNLPSEVFPKSGHMAYWKCSKGHRWEASICCTVINNTVCPICSGKKLAKGVNDLATLAPKEILEEWDFENNGFSPDSITAHNNKKCWWKCKKCNRKWEAAVEKRINRGDGCPYCSGRLPKHGETDLATLHPELKSWWSKDNTQNMEEYTEFSYFKVKWKCPTCGETFKRVIAKQVLSQSCPYCTGRRFIQGKSDLATRRPDLMIEWNYQKNKNGPECYSTFSNKKVWWMCTACGNEWFAMINNRSSKGRGCPKCCREIIN